MLWIIKRKKTFRKLEIGILIFQIILFLLVACAFHEAHSPNPRFRCAQAYDCGAPDPNTGMSTCKYCEENVDEYDYTSLCVKEKEITCVVNNTTKTTTTTRISND